MKRLFAPLLLATLMVGTSATAFALSFSDQYGSAANSMFTTRTVVIDAGTRHLNVTRGETVIIRDGASSVNWTFDGISTTFDLARILPATANAGHSITVYVAADPFN